MLGQTIGELLPLALVIALSPIPIIAVILILFSARARTNSWMFLAGWVVGVLGATVVVLVVANTQDLTEGSGQPTDSVSVIRLALGVGLLFLAFRQWQKRPKDGETPDLPRYLQAVDTLEPLPAFGLALLLAVNPKNLMMQIAAGLVISAASLSDEDTVAAVAAFTAIAVSTVVVTVVAYQVLGERTRPALDTVRAWLAANNSTVMAVLLLVIGVVVLGKGLGILD